MRTCLAFAFALLLTSATGRPLHALTAPESFLGFPVGADRKLAGYSQILRYFETLDRESPRLVLHTLGKTTLGRDMAMAVISSEKNIADIERLRATSRALADPARLEDGKVPAGAKVFVLVTCNIHSSEIASSQFSMEWAHELCASQDPRVTAWLDDVVLLLMPTINPDGTDMIVDYYKKHLGTPWEGGRLPWLYHHYAGHDNNRDWFMLNLNETRLVNRVLHHEWFPQVFLDMHQMGPSGPRMFVPPNADPVTKNVDPMQWRFNDLIGTNMGFRLEEAGKSGVISSWSYDAYWPGGTKNTACLKNVVGLLTEVASCRIATPVTVDPNELSGGRKGLPDYRQQSNFPNPWPGGTWRLRDIVDYERIAGNALLETCATYREEILSNFVRTSRRAIQSGANEAPYAYVIPPIDSQHDPAAASQLVQVLLENGLQAKRARTELTTPDGRRFPAQSVVFLAAQPYRPFLIEMMERQRYPELRQGPDTKEIIKPYDVTAWTLPLLMGVEWERVDARLQGELEPLAGAERTGQVQAQGKNPIVIPARDNGSYRLVNQLLARGVRVSRALGGMEGAVAVSPGDFLVDAAALPALRELAPKSGVSPRELPGAFVGRRAVQRAPRIGLYKPWAASMDEGWTRLVLDRYEYKHTSLDNAAMKQKNLGNRFDVIVLADVDKNVIVEGRPRNEEGGYFESLPPPYAGGIGKDGVAALKEFVEGGGTLVCLGSSGELAVDELGLPVRNAVAKAKSSEFSVPGTLVNLDVDPSHPLAWGMPAKAVAYSTGGPVFTTSIPGANVDRSVAARYPEFPDQVVESGWGNGMEMMVRRAAIVEAGLGKGKVELLGPRVQNRGQTVGTFKFLFNAILRGGMQEERELQQERVTERR